MATRMFSVVRSFFVHTSAVVKSIFLVILADVLFTAFFYFFWR